MRALWALLQKEARQHVVAFALLGGLLAVAFVIQWAQLAVSPRVLSQLELASSFATVPLVIAALILGHRLVVVEYYGHTQRFIEALPVRRGQMELVKLAVGLVYLWSAGAVALACSIALASADEPIGLHFVLLMAVRLAAFLFAVWSFAFAMGFLGRLRVPLYVALILVAVFIDGYTPLELRHFGPLALIDSGTFPFERDRWPMRALLETMGLGAGFACLGLLLGWLREGSLVEQLARPMSQREKSFLFILIFGGMAALVVLGEERLREPYRFAGDEVVRSASGAVEIMYLDEPYRWAAERFATYFDQRVVKLRAELALSEQLVTRVALNPSLAPDRYQTVRVDPNTGIVARANFDESARFRREDLGTYLLHQLFSAHTRGRATHEAKHWVVDGFARHWAVHGSQSAGPLPPDDPQLLAGIVAARRVPLTVASVRAWDGVAHELGDPMTTALAYSGMRVLETRHGREAMMKFVQAVLGRRSHADIREWWHDRRHPLEDVFETTTGETWPTFVSAWAARLEKLAQQPGYAESLAQLPTATVTIEGTHVAGSRGVYYRVELEPAPPRGTLCGFLHRDLPPYDHPVGREGLPEVVQLWPAGRSSLEHLVEGVYGGGQRAFAAVECEVEPLGIPLRVGVARVTVP